MHLHLFQKNNIDLQNMKHLKGLVIILIIWGP